MKEGRKEPPMSERSKADRPDFSSPLAKDYEKRVMLALTTAHEKSTESVSIEAMEKQARTLEDLAANLRSVAYDLDEQVRKLRARVFEIKTNQ